MRLGKYLSLDKTLATAIAEYINKTLTIPDKIILVQQNTEPPTFLLDFGTYIDEFRITVEKANDCVDDFRAGYLAGFKEGVEHGLNQLRPKKVKTRKSEEELDRFVDFVKKNP